MTTPAPTEAVPIEEGSSATEPSAEARTPLDDWLDLFPDSDAPSSHADLFKRTIESLGARLAESPNAREAVSAILRRRLGEAVSKEAYRDALDSLESYLGSHPAYLLNWLAYQDTPARLDKLEDLAAPSVMAFLRATVSEYGKQIEQSMTAVWSPLDDWTRIDKHVFLDGIDGSYRFIVRILKLNGETVVLETTPDSMINLTRHLLMMLAAPRTIEVYTPSRLQGFLEQFTEFIALVPQPGEGEAEGEGHAAADPQGAPTPG